MPILHDESVRYEAARFAWVSELLATLALPTGTPEWEKQWQWAKRMEEQYETAKKELLRLRGEN